MAKKPHAGSFHSQSEEIIREEALKLARATHTPGQTKEQTKLIAKGIAKGIAEYKKQEKSKQRERAKLQKKLGAKSAEQDSGKPSPGPVPKTSKASPTLPGIVASTVFFIAGILHIIRLATGTDITVGNFSIPMFWSAIAAAAALVLAVWIYRATQESPKASDRE